MSYFVQYTINGLTAGAFYALVALGYTIVYGIIRLINFAHGDLTMVGAFIGWTALVQFGLHRLPLALAIGLAAGLSMLVTSVINVGILRFAYRPLLKKSLLAILITALGMSLLLQNAALLIYGPNIVAYPPLVGSGGIQIGGVRASYGQMVFFGISILLMLFLYFFVRYTTVGTAMRALAVDHDAARLMGIDVDRVIAATFFIGSALAGAAGVMFGLVFSQIYHFMGFLAGLKGFTAAVVGGIGSIPGAMLGGLIVGCVEQWAQGYINGNWSDLFVFAILIVFMLVRPTGLLGTRAINKV